MAECGSCGATVRPTADGTCPACGEPIAGDRGPRSPFKRFTVKVSERLPSLCHRCSAPTDRTVEIGRTRTIGGERWWMRAIYWCGVFLSFGLLFVLFRRPLRVARSLPVPQVDRGTTTSVTKRVPTCSSCTASPPEHVDYHLDEITLLVHRGFAKAVSAARRERRASREGAAAPGA